MGVLESTPRAYANAPVMAVRRLGKVVPWGICLDPLRSDGPWRLPGASSQVRRIPAFALHDRTMKGWPAGCFVEPSETPMTSNGASARIKKSVLALVAFAALASQAACVKVAPYERGALAHPTMSAEDPASSMDEHVRQISEGAKGGVSGGGGGCGCN
jgi:hypothetical protein